MSGLIGIKCGTTRNFTEDTAGVIQQVTLIKLENNFVTELVKKDNRGYSAVQFSSIACKESKLRKSEAKRFETLGLSPQKISKETKMVSDESVSRFTLGEPVNVDFFEDVDKVDVVAVTKGKGFAGCVKRHGFSMQRATHGNSLSHRAPGSIGQCQFPGRVNPGKKMAGRMGNQRVTMKNLHVVGVDKENGLLIVKGSVPGANGAVVYIKSKKLEGRD